MQQDSLQLPTEIKLVGTILLNLVKSMFRYFDTLYYMMIIYMAVGTVNQFLQIINQIKN